MATKKTTKKAPPKPKKSTLTMRLEGSEVNTLETLKDATREKSGTKALLKAANYYLVDRADDQKLIRDQENKIEALEDKIERWDYFKTAFKELIADNDDHTAKKNNDSKSNQGAGGQGTKKLSKEVCTDCFETLEA